jgi:hypothetical protein
MKDEAEAITVVEVSGEVSEAAAAVTSEAVTVSREVKAVVDISHYLHVRRSVTSVINQVAGQQNTLLKSESKRTTNSVNTLPVFIKNPQSYTTKAS